MFYNNVDHNFSYFCFFYCRHLGFRNRVKNFHTKLKERVTKLDLFKKESFNNPVANTEHWGILSTRIYIIAFAFCILVFILFTGIADVRTTIVVPSPSVDTFEQLYTMYGIQVSCPCQTSSFLYKVFFSSKARYHQVCI